MRRVMKPSRHSKIGRPARKLYNSIIASKQKVARFEKRAVKLQPVLMAKIRKMDTTVNSLKKQVEDLKENKKQQADLIKKLRFNRGVLGAHLTKARKREKLLEMQVRKAQEKATSYMHQAKVFQEKAIEEVRLAATRLACAETKMANAEETMKAEAARSKKARKAQHSLSCVFAHAAQEWAAFGSRCR